MEIAIGIIFAIIVFALIEALDFYADERNKNEALTEENTRLIQSNDKLKATLVKKDFEIAKLEKYNQELKKIVEFYDK